MTREIGVDSLPKTFTLPVPTTRDARQLLGRIIRGQEEPDTVAGPFLEWQETITVHPFIIGDLQDTEPEFAAYFMGDRDSFEPFVAPNQGRDVDLGISILDPATGERMRYQPETPLDSEDERSLARLYVFGNVNRPFDWMHDPRGGVWDSLLDALNSGRPDDPVKGTTQDLWDLLLAVARMYRFDEEVLYDHSFALTHIANEIRRRLLGQ